MVDLTEQKCSSGRWHGEVELEELGPERREPRYDEHVTHDEDAEEQERRIGEEILEERSKLGERPRVLQIRTVLPVQRWTFVVVVSLVWSSHSNVSRSCEYHHYLYNNCHHHYLYNNEDDNDDDDDGDDDDDDGDDNYDDDEDYDGVNDMAVKLTMMQGSIWRGKVEPPPTSTFQRLYFN